MILTHSAIELTNVCQSLGAEFSPHLDVDSIIDDTVTRGSSSSDLGHMARVVEKCLSVCPGHLRVAGVVGAGVGGVIGRQT